MFLLWLLIAILVPGLWGNVWFHSHCRKRMAVALAAHTDVAESCAALVRQSSQPRRALAIGTVQVGLLAALGLGVLQFSALMQHAGIRLAGISNASPQMASGKVKEMPLAAANTVTATSAPAAVPAPQPTASAPASATAPTPAASAVTVAAVATPPVVFAAAAPAPPPPKVVVSAPAKTAKTAKVAHAPPVAVAGHYGVNVGLFAKPANAKNVQAKLKAAQLPTRIDTLTMQRGSRTRIRVGPFATQAQADEAAVKVRALGLEAMTYQD